MDEAGSSVGVGRRFCLRHAKGGEAVFQLRPVFDLLANETRVAGDAGDILIAEIEQGAGVLLIECVSRLEAALAIMRRGIGIEVRLDRSPGLGEIAKQLQYPKRVDVIVVNEEVA